MNKERRKEIEAIIAEAQGLADIISNLLERVESVRDEEQEYFDNMPESFQSGDRGQRVEEVIGYLEEAVSELENIDLDAITSPLESAGE